MIDHVLEVDTISLRHVGLRSFIPESFPFGWNEDLRWFEINQQITDLTEFSEHGHDHDWVLNSSIVTSTLTTITELLRERVLQQPLTWVKPARLFLLGTVFEITLVVILLRP